MSAPDKRRNRGQVTRATPPRTVILSCRQVPTGKIARKHQDYLVNEVICPANDRTNSLNNEVISHHKIHPGKSRSVQRHDRGAVRDVHHDYEGRQNPPKKPAP
jgi:hypothetical protein